jgi:hypothetical protein
MPRKGEKNAYRNFARKHVLKRPFGTQTNSLKQGPFEGNNNTSTRSDSQILRLVWKQFLHYHVHSNQPEIFFGSVNLDRTFQIYFNIIISSTTGSTEWPLAFGFSNQNFCIFLISPRYTTFPGQFTLVYLISLIMFGEGYILWISS